MTFDQELTLDGQSLYIQAEAHIPAIPVDDHGEYFGTPYVRTIYESGEVEILDIKLWALDSNDCFEIPVHDPKLLAQARTWVLAKAEDE